MIYLKTAMQILGRNSVAFGEIKDDEVYKHVQKAKVFVVLPKEGDADVELWPDQPPDTMLSLPFETCWFEVLDGAIVSFEYFNREHDRKDAFLVQGVLVNEVSPGVMNYFALIEIWKGRSFEGRRQMVLSWFDGCPPPPEPWLGLHQITRDSVERLVRQINTTKEAGIVRTSERVKLKTSQGKVQHKIRKVVYIAPKSRQAEVNALHGAVEWTHRWLVRGHYRKINGVGKNRAGEYCIKNMTWVTEHTKGPEDAPLIADKVRVFTTRKDTNEPT